jgi:hypothetical protein
MTIFDLLFLVELVLAIAALVTAGVAAFRGRHAEALAILRKLVFSAAVYVGLVYMVTVLSKPVVLRVGDPQCSDDWCVTVEGVKPTLKNQVAAYDVTLRLFSRARRVAQRELVAKDVYLVDANWRRYDPVLTGAEVPLNTLLQPGESVMTRRRFELPADAHGIGLMVDRRQPLVLPICLIIGECGAFHRGTIVRLD